jgi:hypothetical protein
MSDDSFVKEVDDELRTDQFKSLWERYGIVLAGAALAVVLGTAAFEGYKYWNAAQASKSGDLFLAALTQAKDQKQDEALKSLAELEKSGTGSYPVLARMRSATVLASKGDAKAAVAVFDAVAADATVDAPVRDMARLRAALLLVDHGTYEDVAKYAELLTSDTNAMRHSAREALGLSAWKAGKITEAKAFFQSIVDTEKAPRNLTDRATLMLNVIAASGDAAAKTGG